MVPAWAKFQQNFSMKFSTSFWLFIFLTPSTYYQFSTEGITFTARHGLGGFTAHSRFCLWRDTPSPVARWKTSRAGGRPRFSRPFSSLPPYLQTLFESLLPNSYLPLWRICEAETSQASGFTPIYNKEQLNSWLSQPWLPFGFETLPDSSAAWVAFRPLPDSRLCVLIPSLEESMPNMHGNLQGLYLWKSYEHFAGFNTLILPWLHKVWVQLLWVWRETSREERINSN